MLKELFLVMYLVNPPGAPVISQEAVAEMASEAECQAEVARIKALPHVADKMSGFYKIDASCHDQDYIKRVQ